MRTPRGSRRARHCNRGRLTFQLPSQLRLGVAPVVVSPTCASRYGTTPGIGRPGIGRRQIRTGVEGALVLHRREGVAGIVEGVWSYH